MHDYAVVIGRFEPFHNGHAEMLDTALNAAERVIVILGSARAARNVKNPFTEQEREEMIRNFLTDQRIPQGRVTVIGLRDYYYNESLWVTDLQQKVYRITGRKGSTVLVGHKKDDSSYYLDLFPSWKFLAHDVTQSHFNAINATDVRTVWLGGWKGNDLVDLVPPSTEEFLRVWESTYPETYRELMAQFHYLQEYPKHWGPGPFITVDAVVTMHGHVLVVERGEIPGKGLLAIPGGFLERNERLLDSAVRELQEETGLSQWRPDEIKRTLVGKDVFDHPGRSERGRTVTHAFHFDFERLGQMDTLPMVLGGDDAAKAYWLPLYDALESPEKFYEDHLHIIRAFVTRT